MKNKIIITLITIVLIIFFITGIWIRASEEGVLFDEAVINYIHEKTSPEGVQIMKMITYFGSVHFLLPLGIIILLFMVKNKNLKGIILLISSTLGSYGLNFMLKKIFIRVRPLEYFLIEQSGYSFPSGHAMVSMSFYTTMTYLICEKIKKRELKIVLYTINFIIIAIIGFSRIYLGVHWPTDVLMGFIMGLIFTYILVKFVNK
ncbi:phosphatase PAP2 family protein [Clostridium sp. Cult2]|uniref:phosphatase PAP2 family protein n=1 Tax=Clostridium sp. Cult2 TaxID=2079003 RepID=UPI001F4329A1|nr:phosphatase PAP2 family protein [Clostridium sp. Cult2]MCF6465304.1 hypothetical protein [Clostridium sp. Cult2]